MLFAAAAAALCSPGYAQQPKKIPIFLDCKAGEDDPVGERFCSALRDQLALSPRYYEVGSKIVPAYALVVLTMSPKLQGNSQAPQGSFQAGALTDGQKHLLEVSVSTAASNNVEQEASNLLAKLDEDITELNN